VPPISQLRCATAADATFIVEMARHACIIEDWPLPDAADDDVHDLLPDSDNISVVAVDPESTRVGAAWTFHHQPPLVIGADSRVVPEIAIAVAPPVRGAGIGGALLDEMFRRATGRSDALSLNVHRRNPARHLYERKGFRYSGQGRGALGMAMLRDLP
jgi:GNAT superfamily N-acetyltransferase